MNIDEYANEVLRTIPLGDNDDLVANFALGLAGESGEVVDEIKKYLYHGHDLDKGKIGKELGDVMWYVFALCHATGIDPLGVVAGNVMKLRLRYPDGFDERRSRDR